MMEEPNSTTSTTTPTQMKDLQPKMRLEGVVKRTELYGAFVDVGVERDGMVHISQLSDRRIDRVSDVVKEGDKVVVWVTQVDAKNGRLGLTMVEPPAVSWDDLKEGQLRTGKVIRLERYGAFVDLGAERPGLLHVREMATHYVRDASELVKVGEEIEVKIQKLDRRKKRIDLTMIGLDTAKEEEAEEEVEEDMPTALEIAMKEAMSLKSDRSSRRRANRRDSDRRDFDREQEDILSRTLRQHRG